MSREYIVYQLDKRIVKENTNKESELKKWGKVYISKLKLGATLNLFVSSFLFFFTTKGKASIYCLEDGEGLIHYSFSIPYCRKFSFMRKNDFILGPSWTRENCRGNGIHGLMFEYICSNILKFDNSAEIYTLVREENMPSRKGVEKAGFVRTGRCVKTKYLKHYKKIISD